MKLLAWASIQIGTQPYCLTFLYSKVCGSKELYKQLGTLYEQLKIYDQMQKEFIDVAPHELRAEILRSRKDMITTSAAC